MRGKYVTGTHRDLAELERYVRVRVERVGQRDPVVAVRVLGGARDDREVLQLLHLCSALPEADAEVAGGSGIVVVPHVLLPLQIRDGSGSGHSSQTSSRRRPPDSRLVSLACFLCKHERADGQETTVLGMRFCTGVVQFICTLRPVPWPN